MKTRALLILMVLAAFLATSCDQGLFGTNFFSAFENYDAPNYLDASSGDLVKAAADDRFFKEMDETEKTAVLVTLEGTYTDEAAPKEDRTQAALLAADVHIYTTGTDDTLKALNKIIGDTIDGNEPDFEDSNFMATFFGEDATIEDVAAQLDALAAAAAALTTYGALLEEDATLKSYDDNPGDTATIALIGGVVSALLSANSEKSTEDVAAILLGAQEGTLEPPGGEDLEETLGVDLWRVITTGIGDLF